MKKWLLALMVILAPGLVVAQEVFKIELFVKHPVTIQNQQFARDIAFNVVYLDQGARVMQSINRQLPTTEAEATVAAQAIFSDPDIQSQITAAHQNAFKAYRLGIDRLPAAVINNAFIIYGTTDVARILQLSQHHLSQQ
ncbi:MAG: DUF1525 domain-containing protein [Methyloprofundus sp.]|nr:DUF1525 domain-containing protein [Methyloprofundus sp.]